MLDNWEAEALKGFGKRLGLLRSVFGFSRAQFAAALDISEEILISYEYGKARPPFFILKEITGITQCDLDFLISGKVGMSRSLLKM